jgi:hypothetical protein
MPSRNRDEQNPPSDTLPEEGEQDRTAAEPDATSPLPGTPTPNVTVNPRIKNN